MVGRPLGGQFPARTRRPGRVLLEAKGLCRAPRVRDVSFTVREGEIVALAGLVGAGRTEVGRLLFGAETPDAGAIRLGDRVVELRHPREAIEAGVGWVSEDRKDEGLVATLGVAANVTLPHLSAYAARWIRTIDRARERTDVQAIVERLAIRTPTLDTEVRRLSGGNQQKVALARWLLGTCRLLVCDEPTRGVDVGGRYEIYEFLGALAERGVGILMISSDLSEVLGVADRAVVLCEGRVSGAVDLPGPAPEDLLRLAMGLA